MNIQKQQKKNLKNKEERANKIRKVKKMEIKMYLNRTYKNSCNLIMFHIKAKNFRIIKNNEGKNVVTINNITYVDDKNLINSIEFMHNGYMSSIEFNNLKIKGTDVAYSEDFKKRKYFFQVIEELKRIEEE